MTRQSKTPAGLRPAVRQDFRGWLAAAALLLVGCTGGQRPPQEPAWQAPPSRRTVYTVNYPLEYFAQRIGGDRLAVVFPAPPGADPAFWRPDEPTIQDYQQASLIVLNGASYASWVDHAPLPSLRLVNTSRAFQDQYIPLEDQVVHRHGPEGEHAHQGFASSTWLDPQLAIRQAEAILEAFTRRWSDPEDVQQFQAGWQQLQQDLEALDAQLDEVNAAYQGQPLLASHPVYQYLARRCGWNLKSLHWEPDEPIGDEQWRELEELLQEHRARWMIWEAEPLAPTRARLQALEIESVVFEPCANRPAEGDYLQVMQGNWERLRPAMSEDPGR